MVTGDVKIGCAKSAADRIQDLSSDLPLAIVMELPGDRRTEEFLHCALGAFRLKGEWFQGGPHLWSRLSDILRQPNEMLNCARANLMVAAAICDRRARGSVAAATPQSTPATPPAGAGATAAPRRAPQTTLPVYPFKHAGRQYRVFKRQPGRDAPWYFELERGGKRYKQSCRTNSAEVAVTKAKAMLDAVERQELDKIRAVLNPAKQAPAYCKLGDVVAKFDGATLDVGDQHRRNCINCFRLALSQALDCKPLDVDGLSSKLLTADTGRRYFEHWVKRANACDDQEDAARAKRNANSIWRQAICLLTPKLLATYERHNLQLPDVDPFLKAGRADRFSGCAVAYNPPPDRVVAATLVAWKNLDRNAFLAVGLELACGLRKAEIAQVTWGMFKRSLGAPLLDGRGRVKNQTGGFQVPPLDPFWRLLNRRIDRESWRGQPDDLVLTGTATDREDIHFRNIGQWMRELGWETAKTNHALRAYSGSLVAMKYGIYRASAWLRHRSVKTTESHYTHFINARVFNPDKIFIRWAT
jgi:integrase